MMDPVLPSSVVALQTVRVVVAGSLAVLQAGRNLVVHRIDEVLLQRKNGRHQNITAGEYDASLIL